MPYSRDTLARAMRVKRAERKWSQRKLAESIGVSKDSIKNWENGLSAPTFENVASMADVFDCSIDDFAEQGRT